MLGEGRKEHKSLSGVSLEMCRYVKLDEADLMLDMGGERVPNQLMVGLSMGISTRRIPSVTANY